jgi:hypothetical protein
MENDMNTEPNGEQTTVPDIDPGALAELKRQVGDLTGEQQPLTDQQIINLIHPVSAQTVTNGSVTFSGIILPQKFCRDFDLLDVTGQVATAGNGRVTFPLSAFICSPLNYVPPVNLVATPFSSRPVYVTTQYKLVPSSASPGVFSDLEITLLAWLPSGSPAPEVVIDWRCRMVLANIIL